MHANNHYSAFCRYQRNTCSMSDDEREPWANKVIACRTQNWCAFNYNIIYYLLNYACTCVSVSCIIIIFKRSGGKQS